MAESVMFFADDPNGNRRIVSSNGYRQTHRPYITNGVAKEGDLKVSITPGVSNGLTISPGMAYVVGAMYINDDLINLTDSVTSADRTIRLKASNALDSQRAIHIETVSGTLGEGTLPDYIVLATYNINANGVISNLVNLPYKNYAKLKVDPNEMDYTFIRIGGAESATLASSVGSNSDFGVHLSVNPNLLNLLTANNTFKTGITSNASFINGVTSQLVATYPPP